MKRLFYFFGLLIILLSIPVQLTGTSQIGERIFINDEEKVLLTIPIYCDSVLETEINKLLDGMCNTGCVRGYVGTWQIENDQLYLIELINNEGEEILLPEAFLPYKRGDRYLASWFTGELRVGEGEIVYRSIQNLGFSYYFATETFYVVRNGLIIEEREYENSFIPGSRLFEEQLKEISSQFEFNKCPVLKDVSKVIFRFQFVPTLEGKVDYFTKSELIIPQQETINIIDPDDPSLKEIVSLFYDVAQWDVLYLYGEIQATSIYTMTFVNKQISKSLK